jgi:hypothetical protein
MKICRQVIVLLVTLECILGAEMSSVGKAPLLRKRPSTSSSRGTNSRSANSYSKTRETKFSSGLTGLDSRSTQERSAGHIDISSASEDAKPHPHITSDSQASASQNPRNVPTTEPLHRKGIVKPKAAPRQQSTSGYEPAGDSHPRLIKEPAAEAHHWTPRNVIKRLVQGGYKFLLWMCPPSMFPLTGSVYLKIVCSVDAWVKRYSRSRRIMRSKRKHDVMQVCM